MNNTTFVYVGDRIIDLKPGQVVATTVKKIQVGELKKRNITHTNNLKGIWTESNRIALGFALEEHSSSTIPYTLQACKIVQNGIETIPDGLMYISGDVSKPEFSFVVLENVFDFFSTIDAITCDQVEAFADSGWNGLARDNARANTSGIISAILNWGRGIYQADFFLPCFYYHSLVSAILGYTGLTVSGSILTDARFKELVIPFPGDTFTYDDTVVVPGFSQKGTKAEDTDADISPSYPGGTVTAGKYIFIQALNIQSPTVGIINDVAGFTTVSEETFAWGTAKLMYKVAAGTETGTETLTRTGSTGVGTFFMGQIYIIEGTSLTLEDSDPNSASGNATITWDAVTATGGTHRSLLAFVVNYEDGAAPGTPTGYTEVASDGSTLVSNQYLALKQKQNVSSGGSVTASGSATSWASWHISFYATSTYTVDWNQYFADITPKDVLRDFFTRFGIVHKQVKETLYLKTLEAICTDRAGAVDWSSKLVNRHLETINLKSDYAQNNYFNHNKSDEVDDPTLGRGVMTVDSNILPGEKNVFDSVFGNSITETTNGYLAATVPVYDADSADIEDIANAPGLRVLTLKARAAEAAITFNVTARTDYKIAYFVDSLLTKDTGFQYFIDQFYASFETALQKNKVITKFYRLTELDIAQYDPHKMVYDGEGYYIVNEITNFIPGKITKVSLFKVS